jgi:MtaA/CmuA family methyltransferase
MNGRERVLSLMDGKAVDRAPFMPITMMFAADQVGIPYRQYVQDYRQLVQAQLHVAERFDCDYVSCISDPAREAADCGAAVQWFEDQPPALVEENSLFLEKTRLANWKIPDPFGGGRMFDRVQAAALFRKCAGGDKLIEGWIEGPCALAADLRGLNRLLTDFMDDPVFVADLMDFCVEVTLRFARAQIEAGVDSIGIGDAAASLIGPQLYREFVWSREKKQVDYIHSLGARVKLHICGRTRTLLPAMGSLGCDMIDLDWLAPLAEARAAMGPKQVLAGNIDPVAILRNGSPELIRQRLEECRQAAAPHWIVNAGCEVVRDTPLANFETLAQFSRRAGF